MAKQADEWTQDKKRAFLVAMNGNEPVVHINTWRSDGGLCPTVYVVVMI